MKNFIYLFSLLFFFSIYVYGSENKSFDNGKPLEDKSALEDKSKRDLTLNFNEIDGVVVDRTITRLGGDFFFFFSQILNDKFPELKENLTVTEKPTALSGSIIQVLHSRKVIYRTALSPGRKLAKERASDATDQVGNYIIRWQAERLFQDTFDLERDEF